MYKRIQTKVLAGVTVACLILFATAAQAADFRSGSQASIGATERLAGNAYAAGGTVTSAGDVAGDLVAAGGTVLVSGAVAQDLTVAGGNLSLLGTVGGDLRAAGGTIVSAGEVHGEAMLAAGHASVKGKIDGDLVWVGDTLSVDAPVDGDLQLNGNAVTLNAAVKGNVAFDGVTLTLGPGAVIEGNLIYRASSPAKLGDGAVHGIVKYEPQVKRREEGRNFSAGALAGIGAIVFIAKFFMELAAALVLGLVFRRRALAFAAAASARPWRALGWGFAALVVIPAAAVAFAVTIVGIPLAGLIGLAFAMLMVLSKVALPVMLGIYLDRRVMKRGEDRLTWVTIVVGTLAVLVLQLIPFLGWLVLCLAFLIVFGTIVEAAKDGLSRMR